MKFNPFSSALSCAGLGAGMLLCAAMSSQAVPVTYYIDNSLSSLTLTGDGFTLAYTPQVTGALVDSWSGYITGDLSGGTLTLTGGSSITADLNPVGPFTTAPYPSSSAVDAYGPTATGLVTGYGLVTLNGAYRNLVLDITAGSVTDGSAPAGVTFGFTGGYIDYGATTGLGPTGGTSSMVGVSGANTSATLVSLSPGTGLYGDKLILPVSVHTTGSNRNEYWNGTIVAVVPEPATLGLVGMGLLGLLTLRKRFSR